MKSRAAFIHQLLRWYLVGVVSLLLLLLPSSWLVGIYVDGVEGLLSAHGIRWMCSHVVTNFSSLPLASIILGLIAWGALKESGMFHAFSRHTSLKQRRALQVTGVALTMVVVVFLLLLFLPQAVLLSAFGTVSHSAFSKGLFGLMACVAIFLGNVYGYTCGRFTNLPDVVEAHGKAISSVSGYFIILFFASQLIACLQFTGILQLWTDSDLVFVLFKSLFYGIPLLLYLMLNK